MSNNDLISREALKKTIQNREECKECTDIDCIHCFYDIIDNAPTVDAIVNTIEVRPQGEWIEKRDNQGWIQTYCSKCGEKAQIGYVNFCGYCGASMGGGKKK